MLSYVGETMSNLLHQTAFFNLTWGNYLMILVACRFLYLYVRRMVYPSVSDFLRRWGDDRLWAVNCQPDQFSDGCSGTVWYLHGLFYGNLNGI